MPIPSLALIPLLTLALATKHQTEAVSQKCVIGYVQDYPDRPAILQQINFTKITHLNVAFANPTDDSGTMLVPPNLPALVGAAHQNHVKVLISIGGGGASMNETDRARYFSLISDQNRSAFVQKLADYLETNQLDGLDVDLEGPAINKDYTAFVKDLSSKTKSKGKLLTAAVSAWFGGDQITPEAANEFDYVNVMAYDETGPWDPSKPGQHSSMSYTKKSVDYWLAKGVSKSKLVVGVPFYGYGFGQDFTKD